MKVLIIGGAGYIGSVAARLFSSHGAKVTVFDKLFFGGESIVDLFENPNFRFLHGDIRDKTAVTQAIKGVDIIINLAAIVGEPLCAKSPKAAYETNYKAACMIGDLAKKNAIKKYIFISTCSNYGINTKKGGATEEDFVNPLSLYAETKINAEKHILALSDDLFTPIVVRFATVFGLSPRMRFDLLVSEFVREAFFTGKIEVYNPMVFRPLIHVTDAARALFILASTSKKIGGEIFNVGFNNYQKKEIIEKIAAKIPSLKTKLIEGAGDKRDYSVSFKKIRKLLDYKAKYSLEKGIDELIRVFKWKIYTDPYDPRYTNTGIEIK